jgi:hypothetical protein
MPIKLISLIKLCLNEAYDKVHVGKNVSDVFPIQNCLREEDALSPMVFNTALTYHQEGPKSQ